MLTPAMIVIVPLSVLAAILALAMIAGPLTSLRESAISNPRPASPRSPAPSLRPTLRAFAALTALSAALHALSLLGLIRGF